MSSCSWKSLEMSGIVKYNNICRTAQCLAGVLLLVSNWYVYGAEVQASEQNARVAIMYDGSASMKGFYETDGMVELNKKLHDLFSSAHLRPESQVFVSDLKTTKLQKFSEFVAQPGWGTHTKLDEAYELVDDWSVIILVTDNVQDSGDEDYTSTRNFYSLLEQDSIHRVLMAPLALPFDGRLYFKRNSNPPMQTLLAEIKRANPPEARFAADSYKSKNYLSVDMDGQKALAIYMIFSRPTSMDSDLDALVEARLGVKPLTINPIGQGYFFLRGIEDRVTIEKSFKHHNEMCTTTAGREPFIPARPNMRLLPPQSDLLGRTKKYEIHLTGLVEHSVDLPQTYRFYFRIANETDNIVLGAPGCTDRDITMELTNLEYQVHPAFANLFESGEPRLRRTVPGFVPGQVLPGAAGGSPVFVTEFEVPKLNWEFSIAALFKLAFAEAVPLKVKGQIAITVPRGKFLLTQDYRNKYFAEAALAQDKVYSPEDIVHFVRTKPIVLHYDFGSETLLLQTPAWVSTAVYGTGLALLVVFGLIAYSVQLRYVLHFDDTGEELLFYIPKPFGEKVHSRDDVEVFTMKRGLFSYVLHPEQGHRIAVDGKAKRYVKLARQTSFKISGTACDSLVECR